MIINSLRSDMVRVSTLAYPLSSGAAEGSPVLWRPMLHRNGYGDRYGYGSGDGKRQN